jgi:hypothetical protein
MGVAMVGVTARRRTDPISAPLFHPRHIRELASALDLLDSVRRGRALETSPAWAALGTPVTDVAETTFGVRISSAGHVGDVTHFALSAERGLRAENAMRLAKTIAGLRGERGRREVLERNGVYHVLIHPPA